jgi:hypothetical protein
MEESENNRKHDVRTSISMNYGGYTPGIKGPVIRFFTQNLHSASSMQYKTRKNKEFVPMDELRSFFPCEDVHFFTIVNLWFKIAGFDERMG